MCSIGINKTLDEVTYQDGFIQDLILQSFQEIEFVGAKGYTKFGSSGKSSAIIEFLQQQGNVQELYPKQSNFISYFEMEHGYQVYRISENQK